MTRPTAQQDQDAHLGPDTNRGGDLVIDTADESLALQPGQSTWTPKQLAVLRQLGVEGATKEDIELFFHVCQSSGLDPFRREIYMIGRKTKVGVREVNPDTGNERTVERYVTKFTIQTGINGFRKRAREIADQKGIKLGFDGPQWCGEDGVWREVWPEGKPPVAAKFTVFRDGEPISFVAHYSEYVQMSGTGADSRPNSMWGKMPRNQTGKCAEAGAIQRAFPDELGGLILEDAAQSTIIDSSGNPVNAPSTRAPQRARGMAAIAERAAAAEEQRRRDAAAFEAGRQVGQAFADSFTGDGAGTLQGDGEAAQWQDAENPTAADESQPTPQQAGPYDPYDPNQVSSPDHPERRRWLKALFELFAKADVAEDNTEDQAIVARRLIARDPEGAQIGSVHDLTDRELVVLVNLLADLDKKNELGDMVTVWLNEHVIAQEAEGGKL